MLLSVVLCTYNGEKYISKALNGLKNQALDKKKYEIILINNNSKDKTEAVCREFEASADNIQYRYYFETKQGLSFARNRGIAESKGDIIIFLDDDAYPTFNYLLSIFDFFNKYKDVAAIGGKIVPDFETQRPHWMSDFLLPLVSVIDLGEAIVEFLKKKYPIGANMAFRKQVFEKYGNFNPELGRCGEGMEGGEEKDIFQRIRLNNEHVFYVPGAMVYHIVPNKRLSMEYIRKQSLGVGKSEILRVYKKGSMHILRSAFIELIKWAVSLILFFFYFITLRFLKGTMIIRFRYWVTKGFLNKNIKV